MDGATSSLYFHYQAQKGQANKVADALSIRVGLVQEIQLQSIGIDALKALYAGDSDFGEAFEVCSKLVGKYHTDFLDFLIQYGVLFKGSQLCIPKCSMRFNIIKEKHCGGMSGHFGIDKNLDLVKRSYFWPKMANDVKKFVQTCTICQQGKGVSTNKDCISPYQYLLGLGNQSQ